jgi:hypothetical protein
LIFSTRKAKIRKDIPASGSLKVPDRNLDFPSAEMKCRIMEDLAG